MPTYTQADQTVLALLATVVEEYHPDLRAAGVTFTVLAAHAKHDKNGEPKLPTLKLHGTPAAAIVGITSVKDRVAGLGDCRLILDADLWDKLTEAERTALLDHEIFHVQLVLDESGAPTLDDCLRPKLKMRPHDAEVGIFFEVIARHGKAALDWQVFQPAREKIEQLEIDLAERVTETALA